jgi:hypothetical protein
MRRAVLRDAEGVMANAGRLAPRSMGGVGGLLSAIRPPAGAIDATYGAAASLGDTGSRPAQSQSPSAGANRFEPFSPGQADLDMAIDNISLNPGEGWEETAIAAPPNLRREEREGAGAALNLILAGMIGLLVFGLFAVLR